MEENVCEILGSIKIIAMHLVGLIVEICLKICNIK